MAYRPSKYPFARDSSSADTGVSRIFCISRPNACSAWALLAGAVPRYSTNRPGSRTGS